MQSTSVRFLVALPLDSVLGVINAIGLHTTAALLWGAPAESNEAAGH